MKIKLSRQQWEETGKKAGWMKTAEQEEVVGRNGVPIKSGDRIRYRYYDTKAGGYIFSGSIYIVRYVSKDLILAKDSWYGKDEIELDPKECIKVDEKPSQSKPFPPATYKYYIKNAEMLAYDKKCFFKKCLLYLKRKYFVLESLKSNTLIHASLSARHRSVCLNLKN